MVQFACPGCGYTIVLEEAPLGVTWSCPGCGRAVAAPQANAPSLAEAARRGAARQASIAGRAARAAGAPRSARAAQPGGHAAAAVLAVAVGLAGFAIMLWGGSDLAGSIDRDGPAGDLLAAVNLRLGLVKMAGGLLMVGVAGALALLRDLARQIARQP